MPNGQQLPATATILRKFQYLWDRWASSCEWWNGSPEAFFGVFEMGVCVCVEEPASKAYDALVIHLLRQTEPCRIERNIYDWIGFGGRTGPSFQIGWNDWDQFERARTLEKDKLYGTGPNNELNLKDNVKVYTYSMRRDHNELRKKWRE